MQYIGCHLSSSKGFAAMGKTALSIGANTFQFFTRNPRGGAAKDIDPQDAQVLVLMQGSGEIGKIVAHAPYTLNPCAKEEKTLEFARNTMQDDLRRMEFVPGNFYNFHPGSHVGQGTEEGHPENCRNARFGDVRRADDHSAAGDDGRQGHRGRRAV